MLYLSPLKDFIFQMWDYVSLLFLHMTWHDIDYSIFGFHLDHRFSLKGGYKVVSHWMTIQVITFEES